MQFLEGFFVFLYLGSLFRCEFSLHTFIKIGLSLRVFFILICTWGVPWFFFFKNGLSSSLFLKNAAGGFRPVEWDLLHRDDYERLKWPRKKYFCLRKISELCPRKFIVNPRKKSKIVGEKFQKWARKLPKRRGKVGEKADFCPRKKSK